MSIPLPALLGLSHDLYRARKRRHDWELAADGRAGPSSAAACESAASNFAPRNAEDQAETELLRVALGASGLEPRAPDAEIAMLGLLEASLRGSKAARRRTGLEGTDFAWMTVVDDAPAPATQSQGYLDTPCPEKKPGADSLPDDTLERLCGIDGKSDDGDSSVDVFGAPGELLNTEKPNSVPPLAPAAESDAAEAAVARLSALLRGPLAREDDAAEASDSDGKECDGELSDSDLDFIEDISREALLEAEREELARLLALQRCRDVETEFSAKCVVSA